MAAACGTRENDAVPSDVIDDANPTLDECETDMSSATRADTVACQATVSMGTDTGSDNVDAEQDPNVVDPRVEDPVAQDPADDNDGYTGSEEKDPETVAEDKGPTGRVTMEIGIQANDYDIERRSGRLPARRRLIPTKFRDFKNSALLNDDDVDKDDSDFDPESDVIPVKRKSTRKRGRKIMEPTDHGYTVEGKPDVLPNDGIEAFGRIKRVATGFVCPHCGRVFSQKGNVKTHLWTHTLIRPFVCTKEDCTKTFPSKVSLKNHKLKHIGIKPYECDKCIKQFSSKVALQEHISIHDNLRPYVCDVCGNTFRQASCYRRHLVRHTDKMPFRCGECGRRFSQTTYLRSHMKVHTGERPFQCTLCLKAFSHQSDLARHKITHTGLKPYECEICKAKFTDPSSCRRHTREHTSTKPYVCTVCGEKFKRQSQIRMHIARWHGGEGKVAIPPARGGRVIRQIRLEDVEQLVGQDGSVTMVVPTETDGNMDADALDNQRKFADLIQNLSSSMVVQEVEIASALTRNEVDMVMPESVVHNSVSILPQGNNNAQIEIPMSDLPVMEEGNMEQTLIAIAEVQEEGKGDNSGSSLPMGCTYQIIQELSGETEGEHMYEIQYQTADHQLETSNVYMESRPVQEEEEQTAVVVADGPIPDADIDYVTEPDFASQEYFNWLSRFTEIGKTLEMPLAQEMIKKMSHVHKSITDFMAAPSGVLNDKENFRVLMSISKDLNFIISSHLAFLMESMTS